jgi:hypothetical protein
MTRVAGQQFDELAGHGPVLTISSGFSGAMGNLIGRFGITVVRVPPAAPIPGTYWGAPEAGVVGKTVYVRGDTPLHSVLHEVAHIICMAPERRARLDRDAGGDDQEEEAVCYLQVLLAGCLQNVGIPRMQRDMDAWGYSFRLGTTRRWFAEDAEDARRWLRSRQLIDSLDRPTFTLRSG